MTKGEVEQVAEFGELVVAYRNLNPIRLKDVAYIEDGMEDFRSLSRLNGQRALSLLVRRQSGTNLVAVAEEVKGQLHGVSEPSATKSHHGQEGVEHVKKLVV